MTRALTETALGPTIQVEDELASVDVDNLAALLDHVPVGAMVTVEISRARSVQPYALVRLCDLVARNAACGRRVVLHGVTLAQARLVALARGQNALTGTPH